MDQKQSYNAALSRHPQSINGAACLAGNLGFLHRWSGARNADGTAPLQPGQLPVRCNNSINGLAPGSLQFRWALGSNVFARNYDPLVQIIQHA